MVTIPKSFTLNGLAVVPKPSMVVISATAPKAVASIQATFPDASVTNTLLFPPEAIFVVVTAASFNFSVVTFKFLISAVCTSPSKILSVVTALSASFEVVMALLVITGAAAVEPVPAKSPANLIFPFTVLVASGAPLAICASTYALFVASEGLVGKSEILILFEDGIIISPCIVSPVSLRYRASNAA